MNVGSWEDEKALGTATYGSGQPSLSEAQKVYSQTRGAVERGVLGMLDHLALTGND
jgi:hypothetical protein